MADEPRAPSAEENQKFLAEAKRAEAEARKAGENLFFATTAKTRDTAIRSVAGDIRKWGKAGYSEQKITEITLTLVNGLCEFLFNCPLDMLIERHPEVDRKSTRLNSSHSRASRMPSSA